MAERAREDQLPMGSVVRLLVWRGLRREPEAPLSETREPDAAAVAGLACAEEVLELLEAALPEGRSRKAERRAAALRAAAERLREMRGVSE